jgi:putative PIN family toxin of toxin-antitoxin system
VKRKLRKTKVFFNASVIISGLISKIGGSAKLILSSSKGSITSVVSELIVNEVLRKSEVIGVDKNTIEKVIKTSFQVTKAPTKTAVNKYRKIVNDPDDAHVLASSKESGCNYLVSLDKKHILSLKEKIKDFNIVNTKELIEIISRKK